MAQFHFCDHESEVLNGISPKQVIDTESPGFHFLSTLGAYLKGPVHFSNILIETKFTHTEI